MIVSSQANSNLLKIRNQCKKMHSFKSKIEIIGINPFVFVPKHILKKIFVEAGKDKGYIPICGVITEKEYIQTLIKYQGA